MPASTGVSRGSSGAPARTSARSVDVAALEARADFVAGFGDAVAVLNRRLADLGPRANLALVFVMMVVLVFLMLRIRRRAAEYTRIIDEDYASLDEGEA